MSNDETSVLFVCLGNICRSPIAAAVCRHLAKEMGFEGTIKIDSAGTGSWHVGKPMDWRSAKVLKSHGVDTEHSARQVVEDDFDTYHYMFGMDSENIEDLKSMSPSNCNVKIQLLGSYDPQKETIIRDPYYDRDLKGFEKCYEQCYRSCKAFLNSISK